MFIEECDRGPVRLTAACPLGVHGLNCGFQLKAAGAPVLGRFSEMLFGLFYERRRPLPGVLFGERNVLTFWTSSRRTSCFAMQHESQQAAYLGFIRHEVQKDPCQPDCFFGQVSATLVGSRHVVPADAEGGVDGLKYCVEALRQFMVLRDFKADAAIADLRFG